MAMEDGGPRDSLAACNNGLLIEPLDPASISKALLTVLTGKAQRQKWAYNHFSWENHVNK